MRELAQKLLVFMTTCLMIGYVFTAIEGCGERVEANTEFISTEFYSGCEYVIYRVPGSPPSAMVHKGNCQYCAQRQQIKETSYGKN